MKKILSFTLTLIASLQLFASDPDTTSAHLAQEDFSEMIRLDSLNRSLTYDTGTVVLGDGLATLHVPEGFKFLNGKDSEMVLADFWGNPPSESLGMLFPVESDPLDDENFAINITYAEEGYIDDSDAKDLNYDDLLRQMQEDTRSSNEYRTQEGYPTIELVGWAASPYYDAENKKLHWAKELKFGDYEFHTLNYNIRVLGRKGYLELNVIGDMQVLPAVNAQIKNILPAVQFNEGYRYQDFDSNIDKVAVYGIGGLIAGKVLAKAGLLAKLGLVLVKFWKVIVVALIAGTAGLRKIFGKKDENIPPA